MRSIVLVLAAALVGCGSSDTCTQNPASCEDAGQGTCTGQCAQAVPNPYISLLWSGPAGSTPPPCPAVTMPGASNTGFLDAPPSKVTCSPGCTCSPSGNQCFLPSTMTASSMACPGAPGLPFDAPTVWDGTCSTMDPVASARSVTVAPPVVGNDGACGAATPSVATIEGGETIAITCQGLNLGNLPGTCPSGTDSCTYPNVPGFSVCLNGIEAPCPTGWPVQHTFYQPTCGCTCGPPVGDFCTTTVTAYANNTCSGSAVASVTLTSNDGPQCGAVSPAGSPLGSKKATASYTPGMCAATLTPILSQTLCCLE